MSRKPWRNKAHETEPTASPLVALRGEVDRLFDTFLREPFEAIEWPFGGQARWAPTIDIGETDEEVVVRAEVPGIDPGDLDVSISAGQLVLSGEKKESTETQGQGFQHCESRHGSFRRTVPLPKGVDIEDVDAQYAHGVLTLKFKKTPAVAPKRIEIKVKS